MSGARDTRGAQIARLELRLTGIEPPDALELARMLAARLLPALARSAADSSIARLEVGLQQRPGETGGALAARAARAIQAALPTNLIYGGGPE